MADGTGYERASRGLYINADVDCRDGDVIVVNGIPGAVKKQKAYSTRTVLPADYDKVLTGERIFLRTKGPVEVDFLTGAAAGAPVYIHPADDTLTLTEGTGNKVLGVVTDTPGVHGCATGKMRVDMDLRNAVKDAAP